ncbi:MAG: hypothetical protein AAGI68_03810 [Planctomycetota bacterium]
MADPYELEKPPADPEPQPAAPVAPASAPPPPLAPLPTEIPEMRFCPACGYNLTGLTDDHCPKCFRPFDPFDLKTTTDKPPRKLTERSYWIEGPRLAGYAALLLTLVGRILINRSAPGWSNQLAGGDAQSTAGLAANTLLASLSALLLIPWIAGVTFLILAALDDRLGGRLMPIVGAALLTGCILVLGYDPALYIMACIVALVTSLVYRSFAT